MTSRALQDFEIEEFLEEESETVDACSEEEEDNLTVDDVQSDYEDDLVDIVSEEVTECRINYIPGSHVTVDEQLLGFRGRCPFRMYIPNKPSKYGIKIPMICDSSTKYMFDAIPYLVGTLRSNKREIPEELKNTKNRAIGTSMFCYDGPLTLLSYKPKPSKIVYLLSSCDEDGVVKSTSGKPDMIEFYNQTKGGVDSFDQMCTLMSCSRKTNRWPMALFYGMLNMAFVNSYVIYCHNMLSKKEKPLNRRAFMKQLSNDLVKPWMEKRLEIPNLSRKLRKNIQNILPKSPAINSPEVTDR
ncbi:unnamed protein product [Colias eurytheme]|nr:unnamed protein product [Colias eurytheme]